MSGFAGIVLCGGRSIRMERDKATLPFGPENMLQRVVRLLAQAVETMAVVAAPDQPLPELPPAVVVVRDPIEGLGPLQGLCTGLMSLPKDAEAAFVTGCDAPLLVPAVVRRLIERLGDADAAVTVQEDRLSPLPGVYRRRLATVAQDLLQSGSRRLLDLLAVAQTRSINANDFRDVDPELQSLRNINAPTDYRQALVIALGSVE